MGDYSVIFMLTGHLYFLYVCMYILVVEFIMDLIIIVRPDLLG